MGSVVGHAQHSCSSADPVLWVAFRLELEVHDEVGGVTSGGQFSSPLTSFVQRAVVHAVSLDLILKHGLEPDDREEGDGDLMVHFINNPSLVLPLSTLDIAAIDVDSSLWGELNGL